MVESLPKNKINRLDNLAHADKVFIGKDWWENGVCNPRKPLKGAGTTYSSEAEARARRKEILSRDLR